MKPKDDKVCGDEVPSNLLNLSEVHLDDDKKQALSHNLKFVPLAKLDEIVVGADLRQF